MTDEQNSTNQPSPATATPVPAPVPAPDGAFVLPTTGIPQPQPAQPDAYDPAFVPAAPVENVGRGALLALVALPVGVAAWVLIWQLGFIASIVAFAIALLAVFLYRRGSGGVVGRAGAFTIVGIVAVTLVLAFFGGYASDLIPYYTEATGLSAVSAVTDPVFWDAYGAMMSDPSVSGAIARDAAMAFGFGALGCFGVLRAVFRKQAA